MRISMSRNSVGQVIALHGVLDADMVEAMTDGLLALDEEDYPLVVDLTDAVLASLTALRRFVERLGQQVAEGRVAIVCGRLSGRRLLRNEYALASVPIFADVQQAFRR
jgi:hypothetical protein